MKKIIAVAGAFALAACGGNADETETTDEAETAEVAAPAEAAMVAAGTYTEMDTIADPAIVDLKADGSYTVSAAGAETEAGAWVQNDEGVCMTPEGQEELCFTVTEEEEGVRTIAGADGEGGRYAYAAE